MEFPHTYFEDEVREGFYVPGIMKRAWAAQIEVLGIIDGICKKYNIKWFADCGTLLGAVRHGGYIPWDDDLDICMLRPDYIRFNEVVRQEIPKDYVVLNLNNEGEDMYFEHLTRITNGHRLNFDPEFLDKYHQFPYASGIDIFPIDYISENEEEENQRKELVSYIMTIAENMADDDSDVDIYKDAIGSVEELCDVKIDYTRSVKRQLYQIAEKLFALYSDVGGEYVVLMPYWVHFGSHKYPAKFFDKTLMMPFETIEIPVPAAYDAVLRIEYGDYMKIYKNGGVHGYPFFVGQEEHLIKQLSAYPFKYNFSQTDLRNPEREAYQKPREQAIQFFNLMVAAHSALIKTIDDKQYNEAVELLTSCQNGAIQIGTLIEEHYGEGIPAVTVLEQYCEVIYQVFEMIQEVSENAGSIDTEELSQFLGDIAGLFADSIQTDIPEHKEVLFIGCKANAWKGFASVYKAVKEDLQCDVYVMPVPYYERDAVGAKMDMHYEGDMYPDNVEITDYREYDIKKRHPDIIFIQNPYDQCNYTTCIDSEYFSSNIKMFTDKLVYIPWFKLDEIESDNHKARRIMEYYCRMPGIIHSDVVIVQSENMRKEYIECLTRFAGEDTREVWEKKILGIGSPIDDIASVDDICEEKKDYLKKLPDSWSRVIVKPDGEIKKIILYNTTVSSVMEYGEKMVNKIKASLEIFKDKQDDIALIWKPHPLTMAAIMTSRPELVNEYATMVENYCNEGWGVYDNTSDMDNVVGICDAYYGDADRVARKCETMGKPVMLQNVEM